MKTRMIKRKGTLLSSVAVLGTAMLLTACGGDGGDSPVDDFGSNPGEGDNQALLYAYPDDGQGEISTAAPVVLRFSSAVNLGQAQNSITLYEGDAETGTVVNTTPESVAKEPNNVLLQPDEDLKPNQTYTVVIEDLRLRKGTAKDQTLTFTTRPLHEGPKDLVVKEDTFEVSRRMPDGSEMEPVMDFSSFRFQFTQPVDRATATYGDSVTLTSSGDDTVDATLLIDGAYMTVDPDAEYLNAGETYTLDITAELASTYGETFGAESYTFTPKDSSPGREPAILVQKLTQGNTSRLTGKPINQVPVNGTLLGEDDNITQASAEVVRAELADVTTYTDVTPIRLPKGTVLNGAEINPILIGGEVDAGFGSGDVTMTVLSDASGYLVPNPYAENNPDALRIVHLLMDVGIATSEARANGAFTQDLLHIELVGLAEVDPEAGVLNLDAVSMVEPNILGQEYGYGMLSFQLQSYKNQNSPPKAPQDETGPVLQSWTFSNQEIEGGLSKSRLNKPGDPIILNFNEPLDPSSVAGEVTVYKEDNSGLSDEEIKVRVDGSAIIIQPGTPLRLSEELNPTNYRVQIGTGVRDVNGNALSIPIDQSFVLPTKVQTVVSGADNFGNPPEVINWAPVVTSVYPGYPCVLDEETVDIQNNIAGRCLGGFSGISEEQYPDLELTESDLKPADDLLPVSELPRNRPIIVRFSKDIDPESVIYGSSFVVEKLGEQAEVIQGHLDVESRAIKFYPDEPWEIGGHYQYTLGSNGDWQSSVAQCGQSAICGLESGLPLQTRQLAQSQVMPAMVNPLSSRATYITSIEDAAPGGGGDDLVQMFVGAEESHNVLQSLVNLPSIDANANFEHEMNHTVEETGPNITGYVPYEYAVEEATPTSVADPFTDPALDPDGVRPLPNSAKILVRTPGGLPKGQAMPPFNTLNSGTIGCGFNYPAPEDQTNDSVADPLVCPKEKFTYLTGALNAEVTDEYVESKGLKVIIWPGRILTSSFRVYQNLDTEMVPVRSGLQVMRMRYAKDEGGNRNKPIEAWIQDTDDGPVLVAENVDLYLDAPFLEGNLFGLTVYHNVYSYPVTMSLSGAVRFLDDGRMLIEQFNTDDVPVDVKFFAAVGFQAGYLDLLIPKMGTYINYVSNPIK